MSNELETVVLDAFGNLFDIHKMVLVKRDQEQLEFANHKCRLVFGLDRRYRDLSITFFEVGSPRRTGFENRVLLEMLGLRRPQSTNNVAHIREDKFPEVDDWKEWINKAAKDIATHLQFVLKGDFSFSKRYDEYDRMVF